MPKPIRRVEPHERLGQASLEAHMRNAIACLKFARRHLRVVGAERTLDRVRKALKSAEGAQRHLQARLYRETA